MIDVPKAWNIFMTKAKQYCENDISFFSPKDHNRYNINEVRENLVGIEKHSKHTFSDFTFANFKTTIRNINEHRGATPKTAAYRGQVVFESIVVEMLPMLYWDENEDFIIEDLTYSEQIVNDNPVLEEIDSNNAKRTKTGEIDIRPEQAKFKRNVIIIYNTRCCISNCAVVKALDACHIIPFSITNDNVDTNSLLLRADLHKLFDSHLIGINPLSLEVEIHRSLIGTEYQIFDKKKISDRIDGKKPDIKALDFRWEKFCKNGHGLSKEIV